MRTHVIPFSVYAVPFIGLAGLLISLWHPQVKPQTLGSESAMLILATPNPEYDRIRTVFLVQEAKNVANSRHHRSAAAVAQTVANYNLVAQECTPAVFKATHLPPALAF